MGFVQIQRCMMLFLVGVLVYPWQLVAQTGTLSLNVQNVPLKDVLKQIEQKRSDLVGSAFQVNAKQLENLPAGRIDNLLDGMVPGLKIDFKIGRASCRERV